jgi:hypothetical protein
MSRYNNSEIASAFARGTKDGTANNMFISGNTIYSYGHHFPIATRLPYEIRQKTGYDYIYNADSYSNSTAKHKNHVRCAIDNYFEVSKCDISEENLEKEIKYIKEQEIKPVLDNQAKLKVKGKRWTQYQEKIDAAMEKMREYENFLTSMYGGNAVKFIREKI